jgi:hypothetical protein
MKIRKVIDRWVILGIIIILILIVINIPYSTVETHTEKEFYTENEPYNATETYVEKESYTDYVPLNNYSISGWFYNDDRINDKFDLRLTIKNNGSNSGEFWVTFHVESTKGEYDNTTNRVFLMPNESYQFKQTYDGIYSYSSYKVFQTTKEVTKYRDVTKERTVTRYRELEKSRDVVRQKEIKLSFLERILKKQF